MLLKVEVEVEVEVEGVPVAAAARTTLTVEEVQEPATLKETPALDHTARAAETRAETTVCTHTR